MARIQKDVVSYFPHDAHACSGDTLTVLQSRFGNDGYAFWFKLLEKLASAEGHYIDCRNSTKWHLLLAKMGVEELTGVEIMKLLVEMQAIDADLWENQIIWCQKLVNNISDVYKNRRREVPQKPIVTDKRCFECGKLLVDMRADAQFCSDNCRQKTHRNNLSVTEIITEMPLSTIEKPIPTVEKPLSTDNNAFSTHQSKVNKSKLNKTKRKEKIYAENSTEFLLSLKLKERILENNPKAKVPTTSSVFQKWCQEFHLLLNKNQYTIEEIERVIDFSQSDSFWKPNILSAEKLRERFDTLHLRSQEIQKGGTRGKDRHSRRDLPKVYTPTPDYPDLREE